MNLSRGFLINYNALYLSNIFCFPKGFIYFFLFHPQNSTKNDQSRCGLTILHQGTPVDFG